MLATTIGFNEGSSYGFFLSVRIVRSSTIRSLIAIKIEKAHCFTPKEMRMLIPVPSVVCVLCFKALRICMFHPVDENISLLKGSEKSCLFQSFSQPVKVITAKIILHWDMTKKDEC
jgi:hypothetical protein